MIDRVITESSKWVIPGKSPDHSFRGRMSPQFHFARAEDAAAIVQVKDAIWPEEATPSNYIAEVLQQSDRRTILATVDEHVVGFVDGFLTQDAAGQRRWEVDLLAVHPTQQGQGIGTRLVQASTTAGQAMGAAAARGLVAVSNEGSQKAFARAGYEVEERPFNLWVFSCGCKQLVVNKQQLPPSSHLVPVMTLNYEGAWLEGKLSPTSLEAAPAIGAPIGWAEVGTLIDVTLNELNETAQTLGYVFINQFQWWRRKL